MLTQTRLLTRFNHLDALPSPLFKKSWFDPPIKPNHDIELVSFENNEMDYGYPMKEVGSSWQTDDVQPILDPLPGGLSFRGSFHGRTKDIFLDAAYESEPVTTNFDPQLSGKRKLKLSEEFGDFSLEKDVRRNIMESSEFSESERRKILSIVNAKLKKSAAIDRVESIKRYLDKKQRRKFVCQIKYKIRQDLACKRLRVKGKFVKTSKMDLMTAANILLTSKLTRGNGRGEKGGARQNLVQRLNQA